MNEIEGSEYSLESNLLNPGAAKKMQILALSDLHGHIQDARRIRALESNRFDVVVVAGDFCGRQLQEDVAAEIFRVLGSFECPVLFVLGNWEKEIRYHAGLFAPSVHLHMEPSIIEGFCFTGFSGCHEGWGHNPIARSATADLTAKHAPVLSLIDAIRTSSLGDRAKQNRIGKVQATEAWIAYAAERKALRGPVTQANAKAAMRAAAEAGVDRAKTVFVSHSRTLRLQANFPGIKMHLFGHAHGFRHTLFEGMHTINVSATDMRSAVCRPEQRASFDWVSWWNFNFGTYTVIEILRDQAVTARSVRLWPDEENWVRAPFILNGQPDVHPLM